MAHTRTTAKQNFIHTIIVPLKYKQNKNMAVQNLHARKKRKYVLNMGQLTILVSPSAHAHSAATQRLTA